MENNEIDILLLLKKCWFNKRKIIIWGAVGIVVGVIIAFSIPREYECSFKIASETNSQNAISQMWNIASFMGVSSKGGNGNGINEKIYPEIVNSSPFLEEFASIKVALGDRQISLMQYLTKEQKKPWWSYIINAPIKFIGFIRSSPSDIKGEQKVYDPQRPSQEQLSFEQSLSSRINLDLNTKTSLITFEVKMQDPEIALVVSDSLLNKLQRYMTDYYTAKSRQTLNSTEDMFAQAKQNYYTADSIYAKVYDKNQNIISQFAQIKIERFKDDRDIAYMVYKQLAEQVESNRINLQQNIPIATLVQPARMPLVPSSPRKIIIMIAFGILGAFIAFIKIVINEISK